MMNTSRTSAQTTLFTLSWLLLLTLSSCASWQAPPLPDDSALRDRAVAETIGGVTVSGAVLSASDNEQYFAANLNEQNIQTVWVEVANHSTHTLWLLASGTDPDYFSPLEVAWPFHRKFSSESNNRVDQHFDDLGFKSPIPPGVTRSGFLYTNPHHQTRVLNIDLLGQQALYPFTLFPRVPGEQDSDRIARVSHIIELAKQNSIENEDVMRNTLEKLPCCTMTTSGASTGDPINIILVGELDDIASALVRRGYRHIVTPIDRLQLYQGRPPDLAIRKAGQGGTTPNWLRIWLAPFTYQGKPVVLAQSGRPIGGRFLNSDTTDIALHPDVDETRNLLVGDLMYSGGLSKLGFVAGVPPVTAEYMYEHRSDIHYHTDGLRAVMFIITRPLSLEDVQILDWVPLLDRLEAEAASQVPQEETHEKSAR